MDIRNKKTGDLVRVPCGKCEACLARKVSAWSFRLLQQDKTAITSTFITLTYDTKQVPITRHGFMSLRKRDLQLFFKRYRKWHDNFSSMPSVPVSYYAVGEYGGKTLRPHYHIIGFNFDVTGIERAWKNGSVHFGTVTGASVGYTLKYISKPSKIPLHVNDDRQREFALMSKGLGVGYLSPAMDAWHKADLENRMYCVLPGGQKITMPRYYKCKLYDDAEKEKIRASNEVRTFIEIAKKQDIYFEKPIELRNKREAVEAAKRRQSQPKKGLL